MCLLKSKNVKRVSFLNVDYVVDWCVGIGIHDGVVRSVGDEVHIDVGHWEGYEVSLEVGGKVVSINMLKLESMWILTTVYIEMLTAVSVIKLVESIMSGKTLMLALNLDVVKVK